jgi:hypothetical protein
MEVVDAIVPPRYHSFLALPPLSESPIARADTQVRKAPEVKLLRRFSEAKLQSPPAIATSKTTAGDQFPFPLFQKNNIGVLGLASLKLWRLSTSMRQCKYRIGWSPQIATCFEIIRYERCNFFVALLYSVFVHRETAKAAGGQRNSRTQIGFGFSEVCQTNCFF